MVDADDHRAVVPVDADVDAGDHGAVVAVADGGAGSPSQPTMLVQAPGNVGALALDDDWVYWIDGTHGLARTSKRAGGAVTSLRALGAGPTCCGFLAVDAASVYWAVDSEGLPKGLRRTSKAPPPVPAEDKPDVLVDPSPPACVAVDGDAIYWLRLKHGDDWGRGGWIVRASKRGGPQKIMGSIETPGFGCLAVDSSNLYLAAVNEARREAAVRSVPKAGGREKTIASMVGPGGGLKVDDEHVYWMDAGGIVRARKTGGARSIVTEKPRRCSAMAGIALDDTHVYFSCGGFGPAEDTGTVWRVGKRGGTPVLLAEHQIHPSNIAVDHDFVYWSSEGSRRKAAADGSVERLAKPVADPAPE
jgi:hypothetical protein